MKDTREHWFGEQEFHDMETMLREGHEWNHMLKKGIVEFVKCKDDKISKMARALRLIDEYVKAIDDAKRYVQDGPHQPTEEETVSHCKDASLYHISKALSEVIE